MRASFPRLNRITVGVSVTRSKSRFAELIINIWLGAAKNIGDIVHTILLRETRQNRTSIYRRRYNQTKRVERLMKRHCNNNMVFTTNSGNYVATATAFRVVGERQIDCVAEKSRDIITTEKLHFVCPVKKIAE